MRSAADNPLCHTGPQLQAQQCLQARSSPDQGQEGLLGEGQWWTEAQGEGPGEAARGAVSPEVRDQQPPGQVPGGKGLGLLVKSESRAAQPPRPKPDRAGREECVGPAPGFQALVRLAVGLQVGAEFPLTSQDLPGPAALGHEECYDGW